MKVTRVAVVIPSALVWVDVKSKKQGHIDVVRDLQAYAWKTIVLCCREACADKMPFGCQAVPRRPWLASTDRSAMAQHIFGVELWPEGARKSAFLPSAVA